MKTKMLATTLIIFYIFFSCEKKYLIDDNENLNKKDINPFTEDSNDYKIDSSTIINFSINDTLPKDLINKGITIKNNKIFITKGGTYSLNGEIDNGQLIIETEEEEEIIKIILNGIKIICNNSSPIYVKKAKKVIILIKEGTENFLKDSSTYIFEDNSNSEPNSVIFSKSNLIIYGNGLLKIEGNYKDGINCKDGLIIKNANINITAKDDAIRGKDFVKIENSNITINVNGDGIKSDNGIDSNAGIVVIDSGLYTINTGGDGIYAINKVIINNGNFNLISGGGSNKTISSEQSAKGLKAKDSVIINDGNIQLNCADDGIHSDGSILIKNGNINISTADEAIRSSVGLIIDNGNIFITKSYQGFKSKIIIINNIYSNIVSANDGINSDESVIINDGTINISCSGTGDGIHAESYVTINNGKIIISQSYEAIESSTITINGGEINITATNDGINATKGLQTGGTEANDGSKVIINGGKLILNVTNGDGLDSNGDVEINDGMIIIHGPQNQPELGADINGTFKINGGFLVIAEISSQMRETPSTLSGQNCLVFTSSTILNAGTLFHIEDINGNNILTFKPIRRYSGITFSSNLLKTGETYKLYYGGTTSGTDVGGGIYENGDYSEGTLLISCTINNKITSIKK